MDQWRGLGVTDAVAADDSSAGGSSSSDDYSVSIVQHARVIGAMEDVLCIFAFGVEEGQFVDAFLGWFVGSSQ